MKRTIALIMAMLMVLSIVPMAFAEDGTNETVEEDPAEEEAGDDVPVEDADNETAEDDEAEEEPEEEVEEEAEDNETEVEDEEEEEIEIDEEIIEEAGITPDSPLYGLERAMERISLALTFGKAAKAKKGLAHAQERLMEVQAMMAQKKLDKAATAQEGYEDAMDEVEENVAELGNGDAVEELEDEIELEQALNEHKNIVERIGDLKLKIKGLTSEEETQLRDMVSGLEDAGQKVEVEVMAKKDKTKVKIKAQEGLTDEQIGQIEAQVREAVRAGEKVKLILPGKGKSKDNVEDEADENETEEPEEEAKVNKGKKDKSDDEVEDEEEEEPEVEPEAEPEEDGNETVVE